MLYLTHRAGVAATVLGDEAVRRLVFPIIVMDARDMVSPFVLLEGESPRGVFLSEAESPVLEAARPCPVVLYGFYFTWDSPGPRPSLAESVASASAGGSLLLDPQSPIGLLQALRAHVPVRVADGPSPSEVWVSSLSRSEVEAAWSAAEGDVRDAALRAARYLRDPRAVEALQIEPPKRFATLDRTLGEADLGSVLATAPIHVQGLTGLALEDVTQFEAAAVFCRGADEVALITRSDKIPAEGRRPRRYPNIVEAVADVASDPLGYEELHLSSGIAQRLFEHQARPVPASAVLRRWEDRMAGANVAGFLLASMSAIQSIEYAIDAAVRLRSAGQEYTEADLATKYNDAVRRFAETVGLPDQIRPSFRIIQAGERTLYPALATPYLIGDRTRTIKFDMGNRVLDRRGLIRGTSDLARTCTFDPEATAMAALLDDFVRKSLWTSLIAGKSGVEVYRDGIGILRVLEPRIRSLGFLPTGRSVEGYRRDCGHSLGRQGCCSVHFGAGEAGVLEDSMVACTEVVWPVGGNSFAQEDAWFLTPGGPVNLTRHTGFVWGDE